MEYEKLISYESMGIDDYPVGKLRKVYSISELLNGIEKTELRQQAAQKIIHTQNYIEGSMNGGHIAGRDVNEK